VTAVETTFFWDVTLCSPMDMYQYTALKMKLQVRFLSNFGKYLPDCMVLHLRRQ
jgi:hypothetical protein